MALRRTASYGRTFGRRPDPRPFAARAYTLLELALVMGLLVAITAMVIPNFSRRFEREQLPGSAHQLRTLLSLVSANAAFDGKRYRLRFASEDETDALGGKQQPIIEREDNPIEDPESFYPVTASWAVGTTLLKDVRCAEVRLGRPTIEELQRLRETRDTVQKRVREAIDHEKILEADRPPIVFDTDGTTGWVVFLLTEAPPETPLEELDEYPRIELIYEGRTGLGWLQRPFHDEELDLFEDKGWPAVLRQDFHDPRVLTENDVLELREFQVREQPGT